MIGDLVFTATLDGWIYALERGSGDEVWKYRAPPGINGWPAVSDGTIIFVTGGEPSNLTAFRLPQNRQEAQAGRSE